MTESDEPPRDEIVDLRAGEWLDRNRAHWNEVVPVHVASAMYDRTALREGRGRFSMPLEEDELAGFAPNGWEGLRVLHLQCHFGLDTLVFAQRGAEVVGVDFSLAAIEEARATAAGFGLSDRARFVHANVYDARHILPQPESFDVVYVTWGTITWLPDVAEWARIVAWYLKPGGRLYYADGHPAAWVFDNPGAADGQPVEGLPQFTYPYFADGRPSVVDYPSDYADPSAVMENTVTWEWPHPISEILTALFEAGLRLDFFHEHERIPWRMFDELIEVVPGEWGWPREQWLPLALSLGATRLAS